MDLTTLLAIVGPVAAAVWGTLYHGGVGLTPAAPDGAPALPGGIPNPAPYLPELVKGVTTHSATLILHALAGYAYQFAKAKGGDIVQGILADLAKQIAEQQKTPDAPK